MTDRLEQRLQDYLDDRLTDAERAELERSIAGDPRLARRLSELRRTGEALREETGEELSPGFYARARGRFEERHRSRPAGLLARLLSWEAAGLALATVLVAAVFLPPILRREESPVPTPVFEEQRAAAPDLGATDVDDVLRDAAEPLASAGDALSKKEAPAPPGPPADAERKSDVRLDEPVRSKDEARTPPPSVSAAPGRRSAAVREAPAQKRARAAQVEAEVEADAAEEGFAAPRLEALGRIGADAPGAAAHAPVATLSGAVVPRDSLREVVARDEWEELLAGPAGAEIGALGGYDAGRRLVLIGSRGAGLDCGALRVETTSRSHRLWLSPAVDADRESGFAPSPAGCALTLPRDGLPVEVVDDPAGETPR